MDIKIYKQILADVVKDPTVQGLCFLCNQLESWDLFVGKKGGQYTKDLKSWCLKTGSELNKFPVLEKDENMLRIYQVAGKHSVKMGASGIYDHLEQGGLFTNSLKFHLLWAESYAKKGNAQRFREIVELARRRIKGISNVELEAGFRDQADMYLPNERDLFPEEEDTAMLLGNLGLKNIKPADKKGRRRSSIAAIQLCIGDSSSSVKKPGVVTSTGAGLFGPKTTTRLRKEIVDQLNGVSPEEWCVAMHKDHVDMDFGTTAPADDDMDISMAPVSAPKQVSRPFVASQPSPGAVITVSSDTLVTSDNSYENRKTGSSQSRMSTLTEEEGDFSCDEKRRRLLSPVPMDKTRDFRRSRVPGKAALAFSSPAISDVRAEPDASPRPTASSAAAFRNGASFVENAYNNAAALFSDTLNVGKTPCDSIALSNDATMAIEPAPVEKFEVFIDDESIRDPPPQKTSATSVASSGRAPLRTILPEEIQLAPAGNKEKEEKKNVINVDALEDFNLSDIEPIEKDNKQYNFDENEPTLAGMKYQGLDNVVVGGIVTSTPAHFMDRAPTHEDFFAQPVDEGTSEEDEEEEVNEEEVYKASAFMMRRRSVAPSKVVPKPAAAAPNKSMERAMDRLQLGNQGREEKEEEENILDRTGVGRPEAEMTGINPWDAGIRSSILARRGRKPTEQHDFDIACPKMHRNRDVTMGGEVFHVEDLIGEGGFAKVFRCTNEQGQTLALKYEVPSCAWEVYICDQVKLRLNQLRTAAARETLNAVMQISDAYIFSNASVLLNEYHGHGTLLDLSNRMKDPSWIIILYLSIHLAKILRDVHGVEIIHGDAKPDNFMILNRLSETSSVDALLTTPIVKLIDWGRAIDMRVLPGKTFVGRGGTDKFDCPEMLDGRPWNYQTDYFNWVASVHVLALGKYCSVGNNYGKDIGRYAMSESMKRRLSIRSMMSEIFDQFLNIPSCDQLPSWDQAITTMSTFFRQNFSAMEWRSAVAKFNSSLPNQ